MTLRTITYDDSTHVLVPREPTDSMAVATIKVSLRNPAINGVHQWKAMIAAAPEYQDHIPDVKKMAD